MEIQLSNEFITSLQDERFISALNKQKGKKCVIGVGQHYDLFFADVSYLQLTQKLPATGTVLYENNGTKYQQDFEIDMENYATIFSVESNEEKFLKAFKEQTRQIENIKQGIRDIARNKNRLIIRRNLSERTNFLHRFQSMGNVQSSSGRWRFLWRLSGTTDLSDFLKDVR